MKKMDKICNVIFDVIVGYVTLESLYAILMGTHIISGGIGTIFGIIYLAHKISSELRKENEK